MARKWWTLIAVSVATFMLLLDITVVNVALPSIREDLGASFTDLQWVVDAYALSLAALVLTAGSLADRLGRRRVVRRSGSAIFSRRLAALRARARPDLPQPRPRAAGRRRRGDVRGLAGADRAGVPRRPRARHGDGHLRRDDRRRGGDRPARRRRAHRRARLGVDLLPQRPDRHRGDRRHLPEAARDAATRTRPGSTGPGVATFSARAVPARAGAGARQRRGLGQHADRLAVRRRRRR